MSNMSPVLSSALADLQENEGVLVCTNALDTWDEEDIKRAFAIYQFNSIDGESAFGTEGLTFNHENSGTTLTYSGAVLVVHFGGQVRECFDELCRALKALQWTDAEVYTVNDEFYNDLCAGMPAAVDIQFEQKDVPDDVLAEAGGLKEFEAAARAVVSPAASVQDAEQSFMSMLQGHGMQADIPEASEAQVFTIADTSATPLHISTPSPVLEQPAELVTRAPAPLYAGELDLPDAAAALVSEGELGAGTSILPSQAATPVFAIAEAPALALGVAVNLGGAIPDPVPAMRVVALQENASPQVASPAPEPTAHVPQQLSVTSPATMSTPAVALQGDGHESAPLRWEMLPANAATISIDECVQVLGGPAQRVRVVHANDVAWDILGEIPDELDGEFAKGIARLLARCLFPALPANMSAAVANTLLSLKHDDNAKRQSKTDPGGFVHGLFENAGIQGVALDEALVAFPMPAPFPDSFSLMDSIVSDQRQVVVAGVDELDVGSARAVLTTALLSYNSALQTSKKVRDHANRGTAKPAVEEPVPADDKPVIDQQQLNSLLALAAMVQAGQVSVRQ